MDRHNAIEAPFWHCKCHACIPHILFIILESAGIVWPCTLTFKTKIIIIINFVCNNHVITAVVTIWLPTVSWHSWESLAGWVLYGASKRAVIVYCQQKANYHYTRNNSTYMGFRMGNLDIRACRSRKPMHACSFSYEAIGYLKCIQHMYAHLTRMHEHWQNYLCSMQL